VGMKGFAIAKALKSTFSVIKMPKNGKTFHPCLKQSCKLRGLASKKIW